jgi:two-component system OmpR family response regulator
MQSTRILVVDDEPGIADVVSASLRLAGNDTDVVASGIEALRAVRTDRYGLVVLDVMLPDLDGFEVCARLRAEGFDLPVLFLTARTDSGDATEGLQLGGDDYVRKPFAVEELVARVRALLRRQGDDEGEVLAFRGLELDLRTYEARRGDRPLDLTPTERRLFEVLLRNAGRILTRAQLTDLVWDEPGAVDTTTVETVVSRLRRKVDPAGDEPLVTTRRGVGYGLLAPPGSS